MKQALTPILHAILLPTFTCFYNKLFFKPLTASTVFVWNDHAALEPLVTFLYAALFVDIIYLEVKGVCVKQLNRAER